MDMQQMPGSAPAAEGEQPADGSVKVVLEKHADGTMTCNGAPAKDIEELLMMARQKLGGGGEDGMSVEQAFRGGFKGPDGGMGPMQGMGGGSGY